MAGSQFQYDDSGSTFLYFILCFYGVALVPITYFVLPRWREGEKKRDLVCQCEPCGRKRGRLESSKPNRRIQKSVRVLVLLLLWVGLAVMAYKVFTLERDYEEYDPYSILGLDTDATTSEIKKQYRRLSKLHHPDKEGGDQAMFMQIAKAYEALTDEVSRENWKKYGNPDGPGAMSFGIALPAWIVEKQNSIWVVGLYMLLFMVVLPVVVGMWWYRSIKYGTTNVLLDTSRQFTYFLIRTQMLSVKRIVMIMTSAVEFTMKGNIGMKTRPSDDIELSEIMHAKLLPHVDFKTKEKPFCYPYAIKTRILVNCHLEQIPLPESTLLEDLRVVLRYSPYLLNEMMKILTEMVFYSTLRKDIPKPSVDSFENVIRVSQMLTQGMWDRQSPLLQLPHMKPDMLKHFRTRRRNISSVEQFASMKAADRRAIVRGLSDEQYCDIMAVCYGYPHVEIKYERPKVISDEDTFDITASSLVTLTVTVKRKSLLEHLNVPVDDFFSDAPPLSPPSPSPLSSSAVPDGMSSTGPNDEPVQLMLREPETIASKEATVAGGAEEKKGSGGKQRLQWKDKNKKKKQKGKKPQPQKPKKKQEHKSAEQKKNPSGLAHNQVGGGSEKDLENQEEQEEEEEGDASGNESGEGGGVKGERSRVIDEDDEWHKIQEKINKQKKTPPKAASCTHTIHAPFFPEDKQEVWWLYVINKKFKSMVCCPSKIQELDDEYTTDLKFNAPERPGVVRYTIVLMSDSYLELAFREDFRLEVQEKREVTGRDQWRELEEEEEEQEVIEESESEEEASDSSQEEDSN